MAVTVPGSGSHSLTEETAATVATATSRATPRAPYLAIATRRIQARASYPAGAMVFRWSLLLCLPYLASCSPLPQDEDLPPMPVSREVCPLTPNTLDLHLSAHNIMSKRFIIMTFFFILYKRPKCGMPHPTASGTCRNVSACLTRILLTSHILLSLLTPEPLAVVLLQFTSVDLKTIGIFPQIHIPFS